MRPDFPKVRLALRRLSVAATLTCLAAVAVAADDAPAVNHEIKDPHYGDALFHFFQDHYFTALTTLMVSQHFDRVSHHADEAEILRGGMLLSYGLHREAGEIFARLIEHGAEPPVRDRAWFYLAKIRYQRGYLDAAQEALSHVENHLPADLQDERLLLQANLLMAHADYAGAVQWLSGSNAATPASRYVRFNLGIALIRSGDAAHGSAVLDELGRAPAENEEFRSLRDRANVALGFAALGDHQPEAARTYLERVRLKSLQANKALLGFGWAADAMKQPELALVPWTELAQRDVSDAAALEAKIAVPYAYAQLGAFGQSAQHYNDAIAAFAQEDSDLNESITAIRSGTLVQALMERNPGTEMGWFWQMHDLPEMPHAHHLAPVLAQHEFQEAFKNYRDLRYLTQNLEEWRDKLTVFSDMLDTRSKAFAERLPSVRDRASQIHLDSLQKRRDTLAADVADGESQGTGEAFADARQKDLMARVARVQAALTGSDPQRDSARERAHLAAGALTWQLAQDFSQRVWNAKKDMQAIDAELAHAVARNQALSDAQRDEPARFEAFAKRIRALSPLLQVLIPRVAALTQQQQAAVQDIAVAELNQQKERLVAYSTQARFAVAQLYDRANAHNESDHAPAQP
jgi:hypothetical protein